MSYDLVVPAGGRASRMGGADKLAVLLDGRSSLDRLLDDVDPRGLVVAVGPVRETARPSVWCREDPPGAGPLAAVVAAMPFTSAERDDPGTQVAVLCDGDGVRRPLAAAYRRSALLERLATIGNPAGQPARRMLEDMAVIEVAAGGAADDCDTWADVARISEELRRAR